MAVRFNPSKASPSRYATFLECPMKFWIFNLHPNSREFRNKGKSIGQVVDQTLHRFFSRQEDNRNLEALKADFELTWVQEKDNIKDWSILPSEEEGCKADSWQILDSFYNSVDTNKTPIYIPPLNSSPHKFDLMMELELGPDLTIRGWGDRLDKTDDGYEVVDYKTKNGAELFEEKNNLQLKMYALMFDQWLIKKGLPGIITSLSFWYLTPKGVEKRGFLFNKLDREEAIREIKELQEQIKDNWQKYGQAPWPCQCGGCSRLLAAMESRADEWAKGINDKPIQESLVSDLPF